MQQRLQELETELMQLHVRRLLNQASGQPPLAAAWTESECRGLLLQSERKQSTAGQGIQLEVPAQAQGTVEMPGRPQQ